MVILFDLDGTLTDSGEGITKCAQLALSHFGISIEDRTQLRCFVGPPLREKLPEVRRAGGSGGGGHYGVPRPVSHRGQV